MNEHHASQIGGDTTAGQIAQLRHERDTLASAIRNAAVKSGICRVDADLTGPHLLMLADDMAESLQTWNAVPALYREKGETVWHEAKHTEVDTLRARPDLYEFFADARPQVDLGNEPSDATLPEGASNSFLELVARLPKDELHELMLECLGTLALHDSAEAHNLGAKYRAILCRRAAGPYPVRLLTRAENGLHGYKMSDGTIRILALQDAQALLALQPDAPVDLVLELAPIGTIAPTTAGGHWSKTMLGWAWSGAGDAPSVSPQTGGVWTGKLQMPDDLSPGDAGQARWVSAPEMERRLDNARQFARTSAFRDFLRLFPASRGGIANLLAHKWEITALEMQTKFGVEDMLAGRDPGAPKRIEIDLDAVRKLAANDHLRTN